MNKIFKYLEQYLALKIFVTIIRRQLSGFSLFGILKSFVILPRIRSLLLQDLLSEKKSLPTNPPSSQ